MVRDMVKVLDSGAYRICLASLGEKKRNTMDLVDENEFKLQQLVNLISDQRACPLIHRLSVCVQ